MLDLEVSDSFQPRILLPLHFSARRTEQELVFVVATWSEFHSLAGVLDGASTLADLFKRSEFRISHLYEGRLQVLLLVIQVSV